MHIQCTQKMLDFLKPEMTEKNTDNDFFAWHAGYFVIERKKLIVFMNDVTRFCAVLYGATKSDFEDSVHLMKHAILTAMLAQGYERPLAEKYTGKISEITYGRTKDKKLVARLNRAIQDAWWLCEDELFPLVLEQPQISIFLNKSPVGQDHWKVVHFPNEKMHEYLRILK